MDSSPASLADGLSKSTKEDHKIEGKLSRSTFEKQNSSSVIKAESKKSKEFEKDQIQGLHEDEIEYGEDELRNEHDFYLLNTEENRLIEGRFIMTRYKIVFVPYSKELQRSEFFKKNNTVEL